MYTLSHNPPYRVEDSAWEDVLVASTAKKICVPQITDAWTTANCMTHVRMFAIGNVQYPYTVSIKQIELHLTPKSGQAAIIEL